MAAMNTCDWEGVMAQIAMVTIDGNDIHQTIDGFGTAQAGDYAFTLYDWREQQRNQVVDLAFSRQNGIGLTILRSAVLPELEASEGIWNYTDTAQAWLMKEAAKRGPTKLISSVWSPP